MKKLEMRHLFWCLALLPLLASQLSSAYKESSFVKTNGTHFVVDGRRFYPNGFNAYWLMQKAAVPEERHKVTAAYQQAAKYGLNVVRTWAFSDGGYGALQSSPGEYNEQMFKGLDFVISEAKKHGVYVILSLVNNFEDFGGKQQYVRWARRQGELLGSDDDFFTNNVVKTFYKNHVKTVLMRNNTITGVVYRDDPTIMAWELINEARCMSDPSGRILQGWIEEMAKYVKSLDSNHLAEVGEEGFYAPSTPHWKAVDLGFYYGTDFIAHHLVPEIDFSTIHAYPDAWRPWSDLQWRASFMRRWITAHIRESAEIIRKPMLLTEFGYSQRNSHNSGEEFVRERDAVYDVVFSSIYGSARSDGPAAGAMFWQVLEDGMDEYRDGYEIILSKAPSIANVIYNHARRISDLTLSEPQLQISR